MQIRPMNTESMSIAVPAENAEALGYLQAQGFQPGAALPRMVWGEAPVVWRPDLVWGRMSGAFS